MINLNTRSIIYILCPSKHFTGGPLALHQLGYKLLNMGYNVKIFYVPKVENPINSNFSSYNLPYTFRIIDDSNHILIVPETLTRHLYKYKKINKAIWWLSIDNFFKSTIKNKIASILGIIKKFQFKDVNLYYHFAQSVYAYEYIKSNSEIESNNLFMLSDYLLDDFLKHEGSDISQKENIVLYNPKKGFEFTQKIIEKSKNEFTWVAIENMKPNQVRETLLKAKVYIDFGKHPGKDRFPREAAICGCCIMTGRNGSAGYYDDIPIPDEFKFNNEESEILKIIEKIRSILSNFDNEQIKFNYYTQQIKDQEKTFENEIRKIFNIESNDEE